MFLRYLFPVLVLLLLQLTPAPAQKAAAPTFPPQLPDNQTMFSDRAAAWLERPTGIQDGVVVATTAPLVQFLYFPGQDYAGRPWSNWGEGLFAGGIYYGSIGDHLAPGGNAFVYAFDPVTNRLTRVVDLRKLLGLGDGHYTPGKIHGRLDIGSDGWIYFSTHRGSTTTTTDKHHYKGDWIVRHHPATGKTEVVAHGPAGKHCIPASNLDAKRMLFYGASEPGVKGAETGKFLVYDLKNRKVRQLIDDGPLRSIMVSASTGRVYYGRRSDGTLMRYDPDKEGGPVALGIKSDVIGVRAASAESREGTIYTVSQNKNATNLYAFDVQTEKVKLLGPAAVGSQQYIAALALCPTGKYLYYCPGAHGGADRDGTPVVQFEVKTGKRKVIAFLAKHLAEKTKCTPKGTYGVTLDDKGERLFVTWNASRGGKNWDCCALTVIHIPASERGG